MKPLMQAEPELIYFPGFQKIAGPLTEVDPHMLMREVNDDISRTIGKALDFANNGGVGELEPPMQRSLLAIGDALIKDHGVDWSLDNVLSYQRSLAAVGTEYLNQLMNTSLWVTHHPNFIAARYARENSEDLEVLVRYDVQRPQLDGYTIDQKFVEEVKPTLHYVTRMLLGLQVETKESD